MDLHSNIYDINFFLSEENNIFFIYVIFVNCRKLAKYILKQNDSFLLQNADTVSGVI